MELEDPEEFELKPLEEWDKNNIENRLTALSNLSGNDYLLAKADLQAILKEKLENGYMIHDYSRDFRIVTRSVEKSFTAEELKYRGRNFCI